VPRDRKEPEDSGEGAGDGRRTNGEVRGSWRLDSDQGSSESDQTGSDRDQTASDADQQSSDLDQAQSDSDQRASDRDQAASDRDLADHPGSAEQESHDLSRAERAENTSDRDSASTKRAQTAADRDRQAEQRDEDARLRDRTADASDEEAEEREQSLRRRAEKHGPVGERLIAAFESSEAARAAASEARQRAAHDRLRAAADREQAALDRAQAAGEIRRARLDDLTGAYSRETGESAMRQEVERAQRSKHSLVLAYVDIDGLKDTNDRGGYSAGDELLREVATAIQTNLRVHDSIVRMGGDEFVCTFSDMDLGSARKLFAQVEKALSSAASISVGFASMRADETLEELLARGGEALDEAKQAG
jgi:diguanylate cyclase (GGDEF)-like protein